MIREKIIKLYITQDQITLAKWSLEIAKHMIQMTNLDLHNYPEVEQGFEVSKSWQSGKARVYDVRQAGFKIHQTARNHNSELKKIIFRVIGQAVSSAHMKEHSIISSDYAIKAVNLLYPDNLDKIKEERTWQLEQLIRLSNPHKSER